MRQKCGHLELVAVVVVMWLVLPVPSEAAEVNGIWSEAATKDLGDETGIDFFKGWKVRGWAEAYVEYNWNKPNRHTVNVNQDLSVIKSSDLTIEGRTFDVRRGIPQLTMVELELEKVPELSGWLDPKAFGFKLDTAYGLAYDIIFNTVNSVLPQRDHLRNADRYLSHYSVGYVMPIGRGLRIDFGKLVTHIGGETIESIKNNNFSHGYLYSYAIPFQDFGFRLNYPITDTFTAEFYALQGWNVTWKDQNRGKTVGPAFAWAPSPRMSMYLNYLGGPEQVKNSSNYRHLVDVGIALNPIDPLNILLSADLGWEKNAIGNSDASWYGAFAILRYKITDHFEPALRTELYADPDGFTTGVAQDLFAVTLTLNYRIDLPFNTHILLRPEYRFDRSDANFFSQGRTFRARNNQNTIGLGTVFYF